MPKDMLLCASVEGVLQTFSYGTSPGLFSGAAEDLGISPEASRTSFQLLPDNPLTLSSVATSEAFFC